MTESTKLTVRLSLVQELRELRDNHADEVVKRLARKAINRLEAQRRRIDTLALLAEVVVEKAKQRLEDE